MIGKDEINRHVAGGSRKTRSAERTQQKQRLHMGKPMPVRGNDIEKPGILPALLRMLRYGVPATGMCWRLKMISHGLEHSISMYTSMCGHPGPAT